MWALVHPSWWWALAAWLQNKADFCVHVANSIEDAQRPQDPEAIPPGQPGYVPRAAKTAEELDKRYGLTEKGWQEDSEGLVKPSVHHYDPSTYMTHNVIRTPSDDGTTVKVTGWCTGCSPDNCVGCAHYEDVEP